MTLPQIMDQIFLDNTGGFPTVPTTYFSHKYEVVWLKQVIHFRGAMSERDGLVKKSVPFSKVLLFLVKMSQGTISKSQNSIIV